MPTHSCCESQETYSYRVGPSCPSAKSEIGATKTRIRSCTAVTDGCCAPIETAGAIVVRDAIKPATRRSLVMLRTPHFLSLPINVQASRDPALVGSLHSKAHPHPSTDIRPSPHAPTQNPVPVVVAAVASVRRFRRRRRKAVHRRFRGPNGNRGIVGPTVSACARRRQGSPLRFDPAARGYGLDAGSAHACPDWPLTTMPSPTPRPNQRPGGRPLNTSAHQRRATACRPPSTSSGSCRRHLDDAGRVPLVNSEVASRSRRCKPYDHTNAVPLPLVRSTAVHFCKAFPVSSLHELRATLGQNGAERNNVDLQHQSRSDPRSQYRGDPPEPPRRRGPPEHMRPEEIPPPAPDPKPRPSDQCRQGRGRRGFSSRERNGLEDLDPLTRSEMTSSRTTGRADRNSWLLTLGCQEPAYPMSDIGLARGRCAPPSIPRHPAPLPGSRLNGGRCPRSSLEVRRWLTAAS